jgi:quercetin dioxygenase-like cupin family protein
MSGTWMFLGVRIDILTEPDSPVTVAEGVLPVGASPPLHVHDDLDDSFYLLDGRMVVCCGDDVSLATTGTWVQFPARVPHTFRVIDRPARVLMVHADERFTHAIRAIGRPATSDDEPATGGGPTIDDLDRAFAAHGITNVGRSMEQDEAERWLASINTPTERVAP